jgi:cyclopropane-fatty-acyl-phospholipid synthase
MSRIDASTTPSTQAPAETGSLAERILRRRLIDTLAQLRGCRLVLEEGGHIHVLGQVDAADPAPLQTRMRVHDTAFWRMAALNGSVGAGEAFMDGLWDCEDVVVLMRMLVRNRDLLDQLDSGTARLGGALMKVLHAFSRNTRTGSRRNIAAHYDLGNPLFSLFLDENLMYSSAIYEREDESLEVAATRKLDRICQKLQLAPGVRVVEIGTGWGGFALHAAGQYGCHVTTTTISREQHDLAAQRIAAAGLQDRITLLMQDYRDLEGTFDRAVSIEMIEAIGHQYLDTYFAKVASLLEPDGQALIQAITIEDHRYLQARDSVDFIKRHIFPGSFIPSVAAMTGAIAKASDLRLFNLEDIGPSYALTLRAWRERFMARLDQVRALGYDPRFIRMWEFYLAYCEAGFLERSIGDVHLWLTKPGARAMQYPYALRGV